MRYREISCKYVTIEALNETAPLLMYFYLLSLTLWSTCQQTKKVKDIQVKNVYGVNRQDCKRIHHSEEAITHVVANILNT